VSETVDGPVPPLGSACLTTFGPFDLFSCKTAATSLARAWMSIVLSDPVSSDDVAGRRWFLDCAAGAVFETA
jgi:hypothetical protein